MRRVRFNDDAVRTPQRVQHREATDYQAPDATSETALPQLLQWDLFVVRWLVKTRETYPLLQGLIVVTTSKLRTQDISLFLWLFFLAMLSDLGFVYLWICIGNLLAVLLLQLLAQVPRPVDFNSSMLIPSCADPDTYGFPCVDSHMSIVVLLPVIENTQSRLARLVFVVYIVYLAFTRLCLGTRFLSQIVGSWLTGFTGLVAGNHGHVVVKAYKLSRGYNTAAIIALIVLLMFVLGQWVENNDSRLVGVPKQDFIEVLTNILSSDVPPSNTMARPQTPTPPDRARVHQWPQREEGTGNQEEEEQEEFAGRKDSFYYLIRGMRTRARRQAQLTAIRT